VETLAIVVLGLWVCCLIPSWSPRRSGSPPWSSLWWSGARTHQDSDGRGEGRPTRARRSGRCRSSGRDLLPCGGSSCGAVVEFADGDRCADRHDLAPVATPVATP